METPVPAARPFALRPDRVFDGRELIAGRPLVVVVDERVVAVDRSGAPPSAELPVLDLPGATVLPGLIDTHAHLAFDASADVVEHVQSVGGDELLAWMRTAAARMLAVGITTVRDLGDRDYLTLALRAETEADPTTGPRIVAAGPPITTPGGHCWFLGCTAGSPHELAAAVHEHADRGVDVVKVMVTGGRMTPTTLPHESQYSAEDLRVVVDTARDRGLPVAAHAHGRGGIVDALAAGAATLEHVSFMTAEGIAPDQAVIDSIAAAGTIASFTAGTAPGVSMNPVMDRLMPALHAHLANLYRSGVRLTVGPDSGIAPAKPHDVLPHGVAQLVTAGIPPLAALAAATSTAAEACGTDATQGRVEAGYDADLLVVDGDPTVEMSDLLRVVDVYRRGRRVDRVSA